MLKIENISAGYGDLKVLFDISMHVDDGEVVSLVGANGAGKTTLLRIISGLMETTNGKLDFDGTDLLAQPSYARAELGISHIPQGRGILGKQTVKENLTIGGSLKRSKANAEKNLEQAFAQFPRLKERQNQIAGSLSGGEQQMLAISRALMMEPKLILMDEPSLGLAPIIVEDVFAIIQSVADRGISIFIVEQNLSQALSVSSRGYVLENGRITMEGKSSDLLSDSKLIDAYLGIGDS